ncbi:peptidoglycan-binding protein [Pseudomonas sp. FW215-R2]|uniref:FimV/HubP family polar landmark protein n=1 Tax=unclassified Pseudomonas TaxID=196821 RepID=UPI000C8828CA|nr:MULTISPECIES: FimV/HubP family polar landmark protein [unclassified Pseudomonas]PMW98617.1 peptidoglycan-binding protein [Pseudomonas sp. FW215-R2]PMX07618.1 peptidoglycan-binding protein [Pseudomonas sp. FW215-L1]PMX23472.1 peptidoglycan-binding protein [Pseudomonas sp. FW215-E1]PNA30969.1 peptidoglycan-binding protein [Pseudomonas sp. FW215-R4]
MVQVRKLVLAIAAASALSSGMAHALGLGELTLKSTLNQPLVAEIELLDVKDLTAAEVVPSLASPEDFAKAGVDRQAFLNDLTFTPVLNASGKSVLRITSSKPLSEPMVKFLVQVMWPNGRLLRDYSVLLDPSKFSPQTADAAVQPAPTQTITAPTTGATHSTHTTTPRDTLWEIAAKARTGGSVQQTMLAIQALNPDAFIGGNINRLKTGQVLRLPDEVQSTALPQSKAIAEVAAQNEAWRQGRRYVAKPGTGQQQLDATNRGRANTGPAKNAKDNLSLVSAEGAKGRGKGPAGDAKALSNKLAVTQESLDTTRRDNAELKSRMTDLQSQLDKLQRLIELKNNQLAKLQAEGSATAPAPAAAAPAVSPVPAITAELAATPPATPAEAAPVAPAPEAVSPAPVEPVVESKPAADDEKTFNELLTNPILLGLVGGGAVVLLLLLLLLARRRKAQQEAEKHLRMARALEEQSFAPELDLPESSFEGLEVPAASVKLTPAPAAAPVAAAVVAPVVMAEPIAAPLVAPAAERSDDVLDKAQSHIDGGRLNQAAALLEEGVSLEPQRSDLRLKLMEVYGRQGDRDAFVGQERQLVANGDNFAKVEELKSRFPAMAVVVASGLAAAAIAAELDAEYVKDLLLDEPEVPEAPAAAEDDLDSAFDLSLDDLDNITPVEPVAPAAAVEPEAPVELDEFPADDDLSFESVLQQQTEIKENLDDLSDFDLDLDLGADPAPVPVELADDDFLLDLDEGVKDLAPVEPPVVAEPPLDDLELPADFDLSLADEMDAAPAEPDAFAAELDDVNAELDRLSGSINEPSFTEADAALGGDLGEDDFDFLAGTDEAATKLDLAQAYIDMGDNDGARDILKEVLSEGDDKQKNEAKEMLSHLA